MLFSLIIPYKVNSNRRFYSLTDCKVSLLQKVEVLNTRKSRKFVITCDLLYQTDESSGVSHNAVTIPSFSSIIYTEEGGLLRVCIVAAIIWIQYVVDGKTERRIRFLGAPLRPVESQVQTYLPYDTLPRARFVQRRCESSPNRITRCNRYAFCVSCIWIISYVGEVGFTT